MTTKSQRLMELLTSREVTILMEAHNGLSAKLACEAGFEAIWASGLSISAALGVRDNNEASWTQVLEVLEFMADASDVPILLDGDTGYGNFNNVRRLVHKLEQRGVAGVCLEDKLFPKTNSFIDGERQALAEVDEFCGKLRAAKDSQRDDGFVVVARTEAFIAGWGIQEALLRANAYAESGADVILVHSKRKDSTEIMRFMEQWSGAAPVVIVPTKYPSEPIDRFVDAGIYNFIFANHALRTTVTALQRNLRRLYESRDLMTIENEIVGVDEIFRLQNVQELKRSESRYLPQPSATARALVLAATGGNFGERGEMAKSMVFISGRPLLSWQIEAFNKQGIKDVGVVRGFNKAQVNLQGPHYFDNDDFASSGELASLYAARDFIEGDVVIAYGDIIFDDFILSNLMASEAPITIAIDASWKIRNRADKVLDLVVTEGVPSAFGRSASVVRRIGSDVPRDQATGEWCGLLLLRGEGTRAVCRLLDELARDAPETLRKANIETLLTTLMQSGQEVSAVHIYGHWNDIDDEASLLAEAEQPTIA
ncbi:MAG: phosphoenolpyruvate mutase [Myxococcales bacterium]|nr:phosphoenolpyruvate mutase [Myxococcales bacterium]